MAHSRYRVEDGKTCIDVRLKTSRQLFDLRDPSPFRERDLEPAAAEHLLTTVQEIPRRRPIKIVLHFSEESDPPLAPEIIKTAIRSHFEYERVLVHAKLRENLRLGWRFALLGASVLFAFLSLARVAGQVVPEGTLREALREGLTISGWVALWRPAEVLIYGWWPLLAHRGWINRVLATEVEVRSTPASLHPVKPPAA
jgi:hypothetical protein